LLRGKHEDDQHSREGGGGGVDTCRLQWQERAHQPQWLPKLPCLQKNRQLSLYIVHMLKQHAVSGLHCKEPIPKIRNKYFRKGIARPRSQFHIHVSVSGLYIPTIDVPILLQEICGPILGIYKLLTDT
jgi:hypothetical protein